MVLELLDDELAHASVKTERYLRRADVLAASGHAEKAQLELERALAEANRVLKKRATAINQFSRAKVYTAMGRWEAARHDLRLAVSRSPRFAEANDLLKKLERR